MTGPLLKRKTKQNTKAYISQLLFFFYNSLMAKMNELFAHFIKILAVDIFSHFLHKTGLDVLGDNCPNFDGKYRIYITHL